VRSTRGRNAQGRKITGVEPFPGEDKVLVEYCRKQGIRKHYTDDDTIE